MKPKYIITFFFVISIWSGNSLFGQTIEEQMTKSHPDCRSMFMNAMDILPPLYRTGSFDSLSKAVDIWERSCGDMPELKITRILLNIETAKFAVARDIDESVIRIIKEYAMFFPSANNWDSPAAYTDPEMLFFRFSSSWSRLLLKNKNLDENEKFICKVFSGEIKNPEREITQNAQTYPELAALFDKSFENNRKQLRSNIALGTGVWLPTNNLTTLGVHPSFTFQAGGRNLHNQLDVTIQLRYLHSAHPYSVKKYEGLDSTDYYLGYYIGLDYTYYVVSKKKYDVGIEVGLGYDAFDFAPDPYYDYYDYYDPYSSHVTIGSFNANAGLRFNYYFSHSFYVGLLSRYNGIHYSTHGGTNLSGDAVSIDLIFGFHGSKSRR